jgi:hypothetical protein
VSSLFLSKELQEPWTYTSILRLAPDRRKKTKNDRKKGKVRVMKKDDE